MLSLLAPHLPRVAFGPLCSVSCQTPLPNSITFSSAPVPAPDKAHQTKCAATTTSYQPFQLPILELSLWHRDTCCVCPEHQDDLHAAGRLLASVQVSGPSAHCPRPVRHSLSQGVTSCPCHSLYRFPELQIQVGDTGTRPAGISQANTRAEPSSAPSLQAPHLQTPWAGTGPHASRSRALAPSPSHVT